MLLNWSKILLIRLNKLWDLVYFYVNVSCYMHFHIFFVGFSYLCSRNFIKLWKLQIIWRQQNHSKSSQSK